MTQYMCDCIDKVEAELQKKTGDPMAEIISAYVFGVEKTSVVPHMEYQYRRKNKNGEFDERKKTGTMLPTFCPFCGVRYDNKVEVAG